MVNISPMEFDGGIPTRHFTREPVNPLVFIEVSKHFTHEIYPCGNGSNREAPPGNTRDEMGRKTGFEQELREKTELIGSRARRPELAGGTPAPLLSPGPENG